MTGPAFIRRIPQAAGKLIPRRRRGNSTSAQGSAKAGFPSRSKEEENLLDLKRRRDLLEARVAELQWDLGGLVYEMATRDAIRVDVLVRRAAELQHADAELGEVERILLLEETSTAGQCGSCGAPHSSGAAYCWQCGQPLLPQVSSDSITAPTATITVEPPAAAERTG